MSSPNSGNVFVFDFVSKRYWRLTTSLPKATAIHFSPMYPNEYIVGDELGLIFHLNADTSILTRRFPVGTGAVDQISWGNRLQNSSVSNTLMRSGAEAVLLNLKTLNLSHRLEFDKSRYTLKLAGFIPNSDQFLTCFTNDTIHIWSTQTLKALHIVQPIKARDRKLRLSRYKASVPEIVLRREDDGDGIQPDLDGDGYNFADGKLITYSFSPNGNKFVLSTVDGYLMIFSTASFDLEKLYRLRGFLLKQITLLPNPKERIVFGITENGQAVILDLDYTDNKLIIQPSKAVSLNLSRDGKLLSVLSNCGEVNVWSTCQLFNAMYRQTKSIMQLQTALKKPKLAGYVCGSMNPELRRLLKRERLESMLREYGQYPEKYRFLIWSSLLELPCNGSKYQVLLKLGQPATVRQQARALRIKNDSQRRCVIKVWSCLAHWCKVFGYVGFMPHLIYPFAKHMPKNSMVVFELLVTLFFNHMQLFFEFHPLPPQNYLAMCENILQRNDEQLSKFYLSLQVEPKDYAWAMLVNVFAEVLDEQQWLALWDNILTEPPYFIIFVIVAYNLLQRDVILRLSEKVEVIGFFHDQNPIEVSRLVAKARKIMNKCPEDLHPKRFLPPLSPIPKGVYPKFLKYPINWIDEQEEQNVAIVEQYKEIDARIRHLELEELQQKVRLEEGLRKEEHSRRVHEMEKVYQETLQREEERIACHRKMLLTYQMEVRQRKSEVMTQLQETEQRRKMLEMENEVNSLIYNIERERRRNNQEMQLAEDEIRHQDMELLAQRYYTETDGAPLAQKYFDNIKHMCQERDKLQQQIREVSSNRKSLMTIVLFIYLSITIII